MSKINSQLGGLLDRVFEAPRNHRIGQERLATRPAFQDYKRIFTRGTTANLSGNFSGDQPSPSRDSLDIDQLDLKNCSATQDSVLHSRRTERTRVERLLTDYEVDSQPEYLQKSLIAPSSESSTMHTLSSGIRSSRENHASSTSIREELLKRQNIRLREENSSLKTEITALRKSVETQEMQQYEKLQQNARQLQNTILTLTSQNRQLQRNSHYASYQLTLTKDINCQLQSRIEGLVCENTQLSNSLEGNLKRVQQLEGVELRLREVCGLFSHLERHVERDDSEWREQKELWLYEKEYYKEIIRKLEFQVDQVKQG